MLIRDLGSRAPSPPCGSAGTQTVCCHGARSRNTGQCACLQLRQAEPASYSRIPKSLQSSQVSSLLSNSKKVVFVLQTRDEPAWQAEDVLEILRPGIFSSLCDHARNGTGRARILLYLALERRWCCLQKTRQPCIV